MYRFYSNPKEEGQTRVVVVGDYSDNKLKIAVSRCSQRDSFVKIKGRHIAEGRLNKGKLFSITPMNVCDSNIFVQVAKAIAKTVNKTKRCVLIDIKQESIREPVRMEG